MYISLPAVVLIFLVCNVVAWQNDWDSPLFAICPNNQFISNIRSIHNNHHEDRRWQYSCNVVSGGATISASSCTWHNDVNDWDAVLTFRCPASNAVITGVRSRHNNRREDRLFSFRCCQMNRQLGSCKFTSYLNSWDGYMNYNVEGGYVLVGFVSHHDNRKEDRVWKAEICRPEH